MADTQLESLVQRMLDGGADDATIREAVTQYQAKFTRPNPNLVRGVDVSHVMERPQTESGIPEMVAEGAATLAMGGPTLLRGVGRLVRAGPAIAASPATAEAIGVVSPRLGNIARMAQRGGRLLTRTIPGEGPTVAEPIIQAGPKRLILDPAEAAMEAARDALAKRAASQEGLYSAARMRDLLP